MICIWTVQYHLGLQILLFVEVMICSTEAHSVILMICTWTVQYHLGLHILLFVEVMICIILYTTHLVDRTPSDNNILKLLHVFLMGVVYYKWHPIVSRLL